MSRRGSQSRRKSTGVACLVCHRRKVRCASERPCPRCVQAGLADQCINWNEAPVTAPPTPVAPKTATDVLMMLAGLDVEVDLLRFVARRLRYFVAHTDFMKEYWDYTRLVQLERDRTRLRTQRGLVPTDLSVLFRDLLSETNKAKMERLSCGVLVMGLFHHNFAQQFWCNRRLLQMAQATPEEVFDCMANGVGFLTDTNTKNLVYKLDLEAFITGIPAGPVFCAYTRKDGRTVQLRVQRRFFADRDGIPTALINTYTVVPSDPQPTSTPMDMCCAHTAAPVPPAQAIPHTEAALQAHTHATEKKAMHWQPGCGSDLPSPRSPSPFDCTIQLVPVTGSVTGSTPHSLGHEHSHGGGHGHLRNRHGHTPAWPHGGFERGHVAGPAPWCIPVHDKDQQHHQRQQHNTMMQTSDSSSASMCMSMSEGAEHSSPIREDAFNPVV